MKALDIKHINDISPELETKYNTNIKEITELKSIKQILREARVRFYDGNRTNDISYLELNDIKLEEDKDNIYKYTLKMLSLMINNIIADYIIKEEDKYYINLDKYEMLVKVMKNYSKENNIDFKKYISDENDKVIGKKNCESNIENYMRKKEKKEIVRDPKMSYIEFDGKSIKIIKGEN